jgi:hypothetical protein
MRLAFVMKALVAGGATYFIVGQLIVPLLVMLLV